MGILALGADERVAGLSFTADSLSVALKDGRTITVPLAWYPRLLNASTKQRERWEVAGGGYGIHWPELDEDLSTEGLLRGAPAPSHQFSSHTSGEIKSNDSKKGPRKAETRSRRSGGRTHHS
jgi:hypothetical protein